MSSFEMMRTARAAAIGATLLCAPACSDDDGRQNTTDDSTSGDTNAGETETGGHQFFEGDMEFVLHESQPMVVDVIVRTSEEVDPANSDWAWSHASDEGVKFARLADAGDVNEHHFRIRGLAPETAHEVSLQVSIDNESHGNLGEFTTLEALPGYEESSAVEGTSPNPGIYRLHDWSTLGTQAIGLRQMDAEGRTRWYFGQAFGQENGTSVIGPVSLLDDGSVLYIHGDSIYQRDELGQIVRQLDTPDYDTGDFHHEVMQLANGNILTMVFEFKMETYEGEGELLIAGDYLMEIDPAGEVVWTWSSFEHLDTQRVKPGFNQTFPAIIDPDSGEAAKDWSHANGFIYDAESDTILLSLRHQDWLVQIDHETGEVLWKLGPEGDFDLLEGTWFFHQHSPQWQPDGSLVLYDNGLTNPEVGDAWVSRAVHYELDLDAMTATQVWQDDTADLQSPAMGDVDRMPGGQLLVTDSTIGLNVDIPSAYSRVSEMEPGASPETVWGFDHPEGRVSYRMVPVDRLVGEATTTGKALTSPSFLVRP